MHFVFYGSATLKNFSSQIDNSARRTLYCDLLGRPFQSKKLLDMQYHPERRDLQFTRSGDNKSVQTILQSVNDDTKQRSPTLAWNVVQRFVTVGFLESNHSLSFQSVTQLMIVFTECLQVTAKVVCLDLNIEWEHYYIYHSICLRD